MYIYLAPQRLLSRQGVHLTDQLRAEQGISMHGGLSDREMLVPLLWLRC